MKLGKILFIEKLDVIKKIFCILRRKLLNSNILIVIIILIVKMFITYKA